MEMQCILPTRAEPPGSSGCRRTQNRYPLALPLKWRCLQDRVIRSEGAGTTVNLSSRGLNCMLDRELPVGAAVELSIRWPALLNGTISLALAVEATVVRTGDGRTALRILRHEFKTAGLAR